MSIERTGKKSYGTRFRQPRLRLAGRLLLLAVASIVVILLLMISLSTATITPPKKRPCVSYCVLVCVRSRELVFLSSCGGGNLSGKTGPRWHSTWYQCVHQLVEMTILPLALSWMTHFMFQRNPCVVYVWTSACVVTRFTKANSSAEWHIRREWFLRIRGYSLRNLPKCCKKVILWIELCHSFLIP